MRFSVYKTVSCLLFVFLLTGLASSLIQAQSSVTKSGKSDQDKGASTILDLKPQTIVTKKAGRVEDTPQGKVYHFIYRVQARPTAEKAPKYLVDPKYSITFTKKNFQANDTITLLSTNSETETDSPIWVYDVAYVGAGERMIEFSTIGGAVSPMFSVANSEVDPGGGGIHCYVCNHATAGQCTSTCYCCCVTACHCIGCQPLSCYSCPGGCTCSHCRCSCGGCQSQSPVCTNCPPGCSCSHCSCLCEQNIDHLGHCTCSQCTSTASACTCQCHADCP